ENVVADRRRLTTPRFELTDRAAGDLACQQPGRVDQQLYRRLTLQRAEHDANPFDVEGAFLLALLFALQRTDAFDQRVAMAGDHRAGLRRAAAWTTAPAARSPSVWSCSWAAQAAARRPTPHPCARP